MGRIICIPALAVAILAQAAYAAELKVYSTIGVQSALEQLTPQIEKASGVAPGSAVTFASSGIAVAVKAGAPKPNILTPEAFKHALLSAKTVAYSDPAAGGASGVYFAKLRRNFASEK